MSFLYRHLVIPDMAPRARESNEFLFYGRTVTSSSDSNFPCTARGLAQPLATSLLVRF